MASSPSARPSAAASSGWRWSGAAGLALHEHRHVVHPRVVRAQVATADEHERVVATAVEPVVHPSDVGHQDLRCQRDHPVGGAEHVGEPSLQGTVVDAVRVGQELLEGEPVGVGAEALAVRARAEEEVEDPLGAATGRQLVEDLLGVAAVDRAGLVAHAPLDHRRDHEVVDEAGVGRGPRALEHERQAREHLPLVGLVGVEREHGLAVVGRVVQRELEEGDVVVALLQRGRCRQDDVRVPRRLVDVDVDRHHALERRRWRRRGGPSSGSTAPGCRPR